jgi:hypothetical protein
MKHRPSEHRRRVVDNRKEAMRVASAWSSKGFNTSVSDDKQRVIAQYEASE